MGPLESIYILCMIGEHKLGFPKTEASPIGISKMFIANMGAWVGFWEVQWVDLWLMIKTVL